VFLCVHVVLLVLQICATCHKNFKYRILDSDTAAILLCRPIIGPSFDIGGSVLPIVDHVKDLGV